MVCPPTHAHLTGMPFLFIKCRVWLIKMELASTDERRKLTSAELMVTTITG